QLGEQVTNRDESAGVRDQYLRLFDEIRSRDLPAEISVKLTHLGLDVNPKACLQDLLALAARAAAAKSFLWIDMEESRYVDATLELYRAVRAARPDVGVCLQAYLRRTPADLEGLLPLAPAIRVVKGAYNEPPDVAFPKKRDVDAAYAVLAGRLLERAASPRAARRGRARTDQLRDALVPVVHAAARRATGECVVCDAALAGMTPAVHLWLESPRRSRHLSRRWLAGPPSPTPPSPRSS